MMKLASLIVYNCELYWPSFFVCTLDYPVPQEYMFANYIQSKLPNINSSMKLFSEELLFYLFYWFAGEKLQLLAAREL